MVGGALCSALFTAPAWADGDEKAPKKDRPKGAEGRGAREEFAAMVNGLSAEQVEKALAVLKERHPQVMAKSRDGAIKLWSADGKAFDTALADLKEHDLLTADVQVHRPGHVAVKEGGGKDVGVKGAPRPTEFDQMIAALEKKLEALRGTGDDEKVAVIERHLVELRAARKAAQDMPPAKDMGAHKEALSLEKARLRLEEAKVAYERAQRAAGAQQAAKPFHTADEAAALRHHLEMLSRQDGQGARPRAPAHPLIPHMPGAPGGEPRGMGRPGMPGAPAEPGTVQPGSMQPGSMQRRIRQTRQAIEHLEAAGLHEHAERARHALERMERAERDHGPQGEPRFEIRRIEVGPGMRLGPLPPHAAPPMPGSAPRPAAAPMPPPGPARGAGLQTLPEGPPPSVGGVRRGTIHTRPHVQAAPPGSQAAPPGPPPPMAPPPPPMHRRRMGAVSVPGFGAGHDPYVIDIESGEVVITDDVTELAPARRLIVARDGAPVVIEHGSTAERRVEIPKSAFVVEGRGAAEAPAANGAEVERLRAEMAALKRQLEELLRALERR
jgi:hypothetical protein